MEILTVQPAGHEAGRKDDLLDGRRILLPFFHRGHNLTFPLAHPASWGPDLEEFCMTTPLLDGASLHHFTLFGQIVAAGGPAIRYKNNSSVLLGKERSQPGRASM